MSTSDIYGVEKDPDPISRGISMGILHYLKQIGSGKKSVATEGIVRSLNAAVEYAEEHAVRPTRFPLRVKERGTSFINPVELSRNSCSCGTWMYMRLGRSSPIPRLDDLHDVLMGTPVEYRCWILSQLVKGNYVVSGKAVWSVELYLTDPQTLERLASRAVDAEDTPGSISVDDLLESISGCFDLLYFMDTGDTRLLAHSQMRAGVVLHIESYDGKGICMTPGGTNWFMDREGGIIEPTNGKENATRFVAMDRHLTGLREIALPRIADALRLYTSRKLAEWLRSCDPMDLPRIAAYPVSRGNHARAEERHIHEPLSFLAKFVLEHGEPGVTALSRVLDLEDGLD